LTASLSLNLEKVLSFLYFLKVPLTHDVEQLSKAEAIIQKELNTALSKRSLQDYGYYGFGGS
jgi:predicted nuclease with TOPRIM domain